MKDWTVAFLWLLAISATFGCVAFIGEREQNAGLPLVNTAARVRISAPTVLAPCPVAPRNFRSSRERIA